MAECKLRILFDKADRTYATSDKVTGMVEVHALTEMPYCRLKVTREWRTHGKGNVAKGGTETVTVFRGRWRVGDTLTYAFSFDVPNGPVTYHGHTLNVDWYISARADIPRAPWASKLSAEEDFIVVCGRDTPEVGLRVTVDAGLLAGLTQRACDGLAQLLLAVLLPLILIVLTPMWVNSHPVFGSIATLTMIALWLLTTEIQNVLVWCFWPIEVIVQPRTVRAGGTVEVRLCFRPRVAVDLRRVNAGIVGRERVISGSGSDSDQYTHVLHDETIEIDASQPLKLGERLCLRHQFRTPPGAAPTFATVDNYLEWIVRVNLGMRWPNWQREFAFTVLPALVAVERNEVAATRRAGEESFIEYDDDKQVARIAYWYQPDLLTPFEHSVFAATMLRSQFRDNKTVEDQMRKLAGTLGDSRIDEILDGDLDGFVRGVAARLLREHADKLVLNRCPKCDCIPRTPQARQCLWCHHDWH